MNGAVAYMHSANDPKRPQYYRTQRRDFSVQQFFWKWRHAPGLCIMMMHAAILLTIQNRHKSLTAHKTEQNKVSKKEEKYM